MCHWLKKLWESSPEVKRLQGVVDEQRLEIAVLRHVLSQAGVEITSIEIVREGELTDQVNTIADLGWDLE